MPKTAVSVLDIGSKSISVLIGCKGVNDTYIIRGYAEREYAGYFEGEFLEEEKLKDVFSKTINDAQSSAGASIDKLFVGVPAGFSYCKTKTLTQTFGQKAKVNNQDLYEIYQRADNFENMSDYVLISCTPISFVLDDGRKTLKPVGQRTTKLTATLSLIYAEKTFIEKINNLLKEIGITTVEYLSAPLCEAIYLIPQERREEMAVVVDCGYIETSVAVVKGQGLVSLKSFSVGGGHISADLMECLRITFDEAEQLRKQLVLSVVPSENDDYEISRNGTLIPVSMKQANEITCDRIEMIAMLIKKCLQKDFETIPPMPYYLTGGGISYIKGGKEILSNLMGVNLTVLCPNDVHMAKPHYSSLLGILDKAVCQEIKNKGFWTNIIEKIIKK